MSRCCSVRVASVPRTDVLRWTSRVRSSVACLIDEGLEFLVLDFFDLGNLDFEGVGVLVDAELLEHDEIDVLAELELLDLVELLCHDFDFLHELVALLLVLVLLSAVRLVEVVEGLSLGLEVLLLLPELMEAGFKEDECVGEVLWHLFDNLRNSGFADENFLRFQEPDLVELEGQREVELVQAALLLVLEFIEFLFDLVVLVFETLTLLEDCVALPADAVFGGLGTRVLLNNVHLLFSQIEDPLEESWVTVGRACV